MSIASKMSAMGLWPEAFQDVQFVHAAGTTEATANRAELSATLVIAGGTGGVVMDGGGSPGDEMMVVNATAGSANLYPAVGAQINGAGAGTALAVTNGHATTLLCLVPGHWFVVADVALTGTIPTQPSP